MARKDCLGLVYGQPGRASAICVLTQRQEDLGLDAATRQPKVKLWWEVMAGAHKSWPSRTPVSVMVSEIQRLYRGYPVDDPRRFTSISIDREDASAIIRGFRELLRGSGISTVRPLEVTEESSERRDAHKREDLLFRLNLGVDQGTLRVAPDQEWLLALDSAVHWGATDADVLGRAACLAFWTTAMIEVGEHR